jgi:voltage-gated potassium channel
MLFFQKIREAIEHWRRSGKLQHRLLRVFLLGLLVNLLFGQLFYVVEGKHQENLTLADSYWWTLVTATTVGYGDYYPQTNAGRYLVAFPLMLVGIGLVGAMVGLLTDAILEFSTRERKGIMKVKHLNHVIICNYPGHQKIAGIVDELRAVDEFAATDIVLITEAFDTLPVELADQNITFVRGNSTQEDILERANIREARGAIILARDNADIRSDERSFAIATVIHKIVSQTGHTVTTTVELVSPRNLEMMRCSGVDRIVSTSGIGSSLLVQEFLFAGMQHIFSELASNVGGHRFTLAPAEAGKTLIAYQRHALETNTPFQIVGIVRNETRELVTERSAEVNAGDYLMLLAAEHSPPEELQQALHFA